MGSWMGVLADLRWTQICYGGDLKIGDREFHGHEIDLLG